MAIEVVAGLIYHAGRLLACQRKEDGSFPMKWEFPGGKVERGEEYFPALRRELREELGIEILSATEIFRHSHSYPGQAEVKLIFFRVQEYRGEIRNLAFGRLLWAEVRNLKELDFLEGDIPLIEQLTRRDPSQ